MSQLALQRSDSPPAAQLHDQSPAIQDSPTISRAVVNYTSALDDSAADDIFIARSHSPPALSINTTATK
jgi:hypothetical protein